MRASEWSVCAITIESCPFILQFQTFCAVHGYKIFFGENFLTLVKHVLK